MSKNDLDPELQATGRQLGILGTLSLLGFLAIFVNIPWEWSMFMDDTLYNSWMPRIDNVWITIKEEINAYWKLGRFYPVKYLANLLKWKYLPNDPYIFRYFNFSVFLISVSLGALAAQRAASAAGKAAYYPLILFIVGTSVLHKPLLETISLNPIGETWVCLFFSLGAYCLFSPAPAVRFIFSRIFFVLASMSKEPAALIFFASFAHYIFLAWREPGARKRWLPQAAIDLFLFAFFLSLALMVMLQATFTRDTYFNTPWLSYGRDFLYKIARYSIWTAPFIAAFALAWRQLRNLLLRGEAKFQSATLFFFVFGLSYLVFMSTQGRVAYQEIPASMAFYCLFGLLTSALFWSGEINRVTPKWGVALLALFCISYLVSVTRWERFVRGIVEPRRAIENLMQKGGKMTILVPAGEIEGHLEKMAEEINPQAKILRIDTNNKNLRQQIVGQPFIFAFPIYMGELEPAKLIWLEIELGKFGKVVEGHSYRIYLPVNELEFLQK